MHQEYPALLPRPRAIAQGWPVSGRLAEIFRRYWGDWRGHIRLQWLLLNLSLPRGPGDAEVGLGAVVIRFGGSAVYRARKNYPAVRWRR